MHTQEFKYVLTTLTN